MSDKIMVYPSMATARQIVRAINTRLGVPLKIGNHNLPSGGEFSRSRGWRTSECSMHDASDGSGQVAVVLSAAAYALNGEQLPGPRSLDFSTAVNAMPAKFLGTQ